MFLIFSRVLSPVPRHGAEVLDFLVGGLVITFKKYLQLQAVANLIAEVGICLCRWFEFSHECRAGCLGTVPMFWIFPWGDQSLHSHVQAVANIIAEVGICLCRCF